jgi:hypothetical protein
MFVVATGTKKGDVMKKLKMFAVAMVAAVSVAVGALAIAPPASAAMNLTCNQATALSYHYEAVGLAYYTQGYVELAGYWFGRADGIKSAYC